MSTNESRAPEPWVGTAAGRGSNGLFAKGNTLASGNPQAKRAAELRKALRDATTEEDVKSVWKALTAAAIGGDVIAIRIYLEHTIGKPTTTVEIAGNADGESIKVETAHTMAVILAALSKHPAAKLDVAAALRSTGQPTPSLAEGGGDGPGN
jgi:hypothetical protein